jgi:adenine-specific DNA-methyltransferase
LQDLLRQLFQFESRELDFGIYRIMNHKRAEIEGFIQNGLAETVDEALRGGAVARQSAHAEQLRQTTDRIKETFGEYAINTRGELNEGFRETPLGKEYLEVRSRAGEAIDLEELKATIFNHVYTFFGRYDDDGDFLSKKRYSRRQKYAVPYNGEEVHLHWANADQYYVKTGEHFSNYGYKAKNGATVRFDLTAADTEQNNVKGEKRFFVPLPKRAAYDAEARELTVPFEYRPLTAKEKAAHGTKAQERILEGAASEIPARFAKNAEALAALEPAGDLARHLRRYTRRNTSDFFIHKDLKGFLEGELDFYLKNEVLDVDDLEAWGPDRSEGWFEVMRAVKKLGRGIIAFLAQIEDFQKRLFEKKKFVVGVGYCLTLDRVPEGLYEEIAENDDQREEWKRLFAIHEIEENITQPGYSEPLTVDFLKANPYLVLDTKHFGEDFEDRLLASVEDLDENTDGLLVESENFQALNLLRERYREGVRCIYIDPPYNTGSGDFLYKDTYQHSSWLTMIEDRLRAGREALTEDGVMFVSIDDHEVDRLRLLLEKVVGAENFIAELVWEKGRKNDAKLFSVGHEYMLVYTRSLATLRARGVVWREPKPGAQEIWQEYIRMRIKYNADHEAVQRDLREWYRRLPEQHPSKALSRYKHVDEHGPWRDRDISWPGGGGPKYKVIHPITKKPCVVPDAGWRFSTPEAMQEQIELGLVVFREDHTKPPIRKAHLHPIAAELPGESEYLSANGEDNLDKENGEAVAVGMQVMPSVIYKQSQVAVKKLRHMLGAKNFDNPKDHEVLARLIDYCTASDAGDVMLDFFAGSGTTGHAVIDLNREDGGNRKYILVEMGEYFETVLKPRILKVIYSKDWKDGRPVSREGTSHAFKYLKLESYEDALNNVAFTDEEAGQKALEVYGEDYLLRYMLDFETRGSETLLNIEKLASPFRYTLRLRGGAANGGEARELPVDLPETFAYLLGLRVRTRKAYRDGEGRRYLAYQGTTPERGEVAVIWRDTEGWGEEDYERDRDFVRETGMTGGANEVFVNGDSFIPEARALDGLFKERMLAGPNNVG